MKNISIEQAFELGSADQITTTTVVMKEVGVFFVFCFYNGTAYHCCF